MEWLWVFLVGVAFGLVYQAGHRPTATRCAVRIGRLEGATAALWHRPPERRLGGVANSPRATRESTSALA